MGLSYDLISLGALVEEDHIHVPRLNLHDWYFSCIGLIISFQKSLMGFLPFGFPRINISLFVSLVHGYLSNMLVFTYIENETMLIVG